MRAEVPLRPPCQGEISSSCGQAPIGKVPAAEAAVERLLQDRGLDPECDQQGQRSFCLRLPDRNNFRSALQEQNKVGSGGAFFVALLLILLAIGAAGLQV